MSLAPETDHAATRKPADGAAQQRGGRPAALISQDLHVGDAAVIIYRDMGVLVAGALDALPAVAMNAVPDAQNPRDRLDIQVHEFPGPRALVADDRNRAAPLFAQGSPTYVPFSPTSVNGALDRRPEELRRLREPDESTRGFIA